MKFAQMVQSEPVQETIVPTMEAIAFQYNDPFLPQLEEVVKEYMELVKADTPEKVIEGNKDLKDRFSKLVMDRLGLNVYLITNSHLAATMPNVYVSHSAVVRDAMREYFKMDPSNSGQTLLNVKADGSKLGTVNFEKAKVTGWFSEQPVPVFINFIELMKMADFTSGEITAIIAHELGHDFEGVAQASRINSSNQVIADVVRYIGQKRKEADVTYVYRELRKLDPELEKETVDGLINGDTVVMGISAYRVVQGCVQSLSGSKVYDRTTYEALSDSFATRFGYGAQLATGLDKLINTPSRFVLNILMTYLTTAGFITLIVNLFQLLRRVAAGDATFNILIGIIQRAVGVYVIAKMNRVTTEDYVYDRDTDRFNRIRQNLIESLKNPAIDKATRVAVLEQIEAADKAMKNSKTLPNPVQIALMGVFASDRNAKTAIDGQKQIERLLANDLFIKSSKLQTK